jgi:hypothetical protein
VTPPSEVSTGSQWIAFAPARQSGDDLVRQESFGPVLTASARTGAGPGAGDDIFNHSSVRHWAVPPAGEASKPHLPLPRGPITCALLRALSQPPHALSIPPVDTHDAILDEDLQLALYCSYELHYQGFRDVSDEWEWEPSLLAVRRTLEGAFERQLRAVHPPHAGIDASSVECKLWQMSRADGFSLSKWLLQHGSRFHAQEFAIHRSGYQLKEADPHTWGIPRLHGRAKAALVKIQTDEYGGGDDAQMHSSLFADAMTALDLNPSYGAYLNRLPAVTLATTNLISMFGLHRRLRGALIGHLASFEMNSVGPMGRYSRWLESLGVPPSGRRFYDVHVEADEVHQYIAVEQLVRGLLEDEPEQAEEVVFGAEAVAQIERAFAAHVVSAWKNDRSSLWAP